MHSNMIDGRGYTAMQLIKELEFDASNKDETNKATQCFACAMALDMDCTLTYDGENQLLIVRIYAKPKE